MSIHDLNEKMDMILSRLESLENKFDMFVASNYVILKETHKKNITSKCKNKLLNLLKYQNINPELLQIINDITEISTCYCINDCDPYHHITTKINDKPFFLKILKHRYYEAVSTPYGVCFTYDNMQINGSNHIHIIDRDDDIFNSGYDFRNNKSFKNFWFISLYNNINFKSCTYDEFGYFMNILVNKCNEYCEQKPMRDYIKYDDEENLGD
jgi:hypothetical protein